MYRFTLLYAFVVFLISSCLSPKEFKVSDDEDLNALISLIELQPSTLINATLEKEVKIGDEVERKKTKIDSSFFEYDFQVLNGMNLSLILLGGGYDKNVSGENIAFTRKPDEKKGPLSLTLTKSDDGNITSFVIVENTKNILYHSESISNFQFDPNQKLSNYSINGLQKLMGLETSKYSIKGQVVSN